MLRILEQFQLQGKPVACKPYGNGHINETYFVTTSAGHAYILQKINRYVFQNVPVLMGNIQAVTDRLVLKDPEPRHSLRLIPTTDDQTYMLTAQGDYYRVYDFITDSLCLENPETEADLYESGIAFGRFQRMLADFQTDKLHETILRFHDTPRRFQALHQAIAADPLGRVAACLDEIRFALDRQKDAGHLAALGRAGSLPLRVTHNDTKLNNVLLDAATRKALCVIDLDTVMPGWVANDFGDAIRFGANIGAEDETDLSKIGLSLQRYQAFTQGFLTACGGALTDLEIKTLPWGARLMTLECGVRFLTDYLSGDVYFHIRRPAHNLDRARTQLKLLRDMESKWTKMNDIVV